VGVFVDLGRTRLGKANYLELQNVYFGGLRIEACDMYIIDEKFIQNFVGEPKRKIIILEM
jgi:hypothetical protein